MKREAPKASRSHRVAVRTDGRVVLASKKTLLGEIIQYGLTEEPTIIDSADVGAKFIEQLRQRPYLFVEDVPS